MMPYRPKALRLVSCALDPRAPAPPFELASWSADATSIAVLVDASRLEPGDPEAVAAQIPLATALPAASHVYILEVAARHRGVIGIDQAYDQDLSGYALHGACRKRVCMRSRRHRRRQRLRFGMGDQFTLLSASASLSATSPKPAFVSVMTSPPSTAFCPSMSPMREFMLDTSCAI